MNEVPVRLLRATLQARGPADPSPECLDAETVAAWADDTLGRDERRAAEAHAADCGRCQALVAAMAQTAPPAAGRSWWRAPVMGWLVPLTAAAAALLVWMSVPGTPRGPSSQRWSRMRSSRNRRRLRRAVSTPTTGHQPAVGGAGRREGEQPGRNQSRPRQRAALRRRQEQRARRPPWRRHCLEAAGGPPLPAPSMPPPAPPAPPQLQPADADRTAAGRPPVGGQRTAVAQLELANARTLAARRAAAHDGDRFDEPRQPVAHPGQRRGPALDRRRNDLGGAADRRDRDAHRRRVAGAIDLLAGRAARDRPAVDRWPLLAAHRVSREPPI